MDSIPGQGTKIPLAVEQLSLHVVTTEPTTEPAHSEARVPHLESPCATMKDPT